jgi:hypothetical protein
VSLLLENPWPALAIGGLATCILIGGLVRTGRRGLLYAIIGIVLLTAVAVAVEQFVVTPSEEIAATLRQIARDIESNDPERVVQHVADQAAALRSEVRRLMPQIVIHEARVKRNLRVDFRSNPSEAAATARFNAVALVSDRNGLSPRRLSPWFFIVEFRRENGRWKVLAYERRDPREGL